MHEVLKSFDAVHVDAERKCQPGYRLFVLVLAIAASAGFATPLGYQTNLMVMGPGGYKPHDFLRFGGPLTIVVGIVTVLLTSLMY